MTLLLTTFYGRTLIVKIALVVVVGFVGLLNSSLLHPAVGAPLARLFRRPRGWTVLPLRRFPVLLAIELALGALVFLATGLMTSAFPPHGPQFAAAPPAASGLAPTQQADDLLVVLQDVKPNRPGQNIISIRVADTRRPSPAEILRVIARFTYLGQNLGVVSADAYNVAQDATEGLWQLNGNALSVAGPWRIDVVVRRKGLEDSTASFNWTVAGPDFARPVTISNRPLEPVLTVAAAVLLLTVLLAAVLIWLRRPRLTSQSEGDARVKG